jgi:arylsulfatase A-like enzyme
MPRRPNILLIHADQHRIDCLGAYGNREVRTPNLDALAADGVTYANSFCSFPVCTPSRYSLITGLYVHQHLGWTNHCTLPSGIPMFPRLLRQAGYRTAAVGKMHFTPTYLDVGFEDMCLSEQNGPGRYDDDYHRWLMAEGLCPGVDFMDQEREFRSNATREYWDNVGAMESDLDEEHHSTTWVAERAIERLETWQGGGNLLMVGFVKPHHPFDPPAPWSTLYDPAEVTPLPGWTEQPVNGDVEFNRGYFPHAELTDRKVRQATAMYYATITQIDHHVGRMLDLLRQKGLYEDTLVVYTSDHGDYMGYHHLLLKGNRLYEPLAKVPLLVKYPGNPRAGEQDESLVSNVDLAPTFLQAAELPVPRGLPGRNLAADAGPEFVFAEDPGARTYMVRSARYKLMLDRNEANSLFFDLAEDPHELCNRYADPACQDEIRRHRDALFRWALFDARTPVCLDEHAPVIDAANAVGFEPDRRRVEVDYFRERMREFGVPPVD